MNLVTIIGKVKTYSENDIVVDVDNTLFTIKRVEDNNKQLISSGDIIGIIGKINNNNEIQAKHISVF